MKKRPPNKLQKPQNDPRRIGCVTASEGAAGLLKTKTGKPPSTRKKYAHRLAEDRVKRKITQKWREDDDKDSDLPRAPYIVRRGRILEPMALQIAETLLDIKITDVNFELHPTIEYFGASPDGICDDMLVEVKAQTGGSHSMTRNEQVIPDNYQFQMLLQLACWRHKGYKKVMFISIDDEFPRMDQQVGIAYYEPPEKEILATENDVREFLKEIKSIEDELRKIK
ncbi:MAG: hypothetical protein CBD88_07190 [Flavobacteriales bacterium TMED228]|nr:MAG: hypothetical protein CBD88_07190 [Flavobacteriales bacterium TMED228]